MRVVDERINPATVYALPGCTIILSDLPVGLLRKMPPSCDEALALLVIRIKEGDNLPPEAILLTTPEEPGT